MIQELKELGLTEYESKVYLALLKIGKSGATDIVVKSKVPHGRIYEILGNLQEKGLVRIVPGKTKKFVPTRPELLDYMAERKIEKINKIRSKIKDIIKKRKFLPDEVVFVTRGKKNFSRLVAALPYAKEYGYSIKHDFKFHPMWVKWDKKMKKQGVDLRTMGPINVESKNNIKKWIKQGFTIKEFPAEGVAMGIHDGKRTLISLIEEDITILINSKNFTKMMETFFKDSWKLRKRIKLRNLK